MNAHFQLIDQFQSAADEIFENEDNPHGWNEIFFIMDLVRVKLDDLDAVAAQVPAEEVA